MTASVKDHRPAFFAVPLDAPEDISTSS